MRHSISSRDGIRVVWQVWNVVGSQSLNCLARVRLTLAATPVIAAFLTTILNALPIALTAQLVADVPETNTQNPNVSTEEVKWFKEKVKQIKPHLKTLFKERRTLYLFLA